MSPRTPHPEAEIVIPAGAVRLRGTLSLPPDPHALVLFAHGSGSGRMSPRNRSVAAALQNAGLATLLFDLLSTDEEGDRANVFDIPLLARRLRHATAWARADHRTARLPIGYFGASTGAAAALVAGAEEPGVIAVVSRGGRPDLAGGALGRVAAPTLLIVGGNDFGVIERNVQALRALRCAKRLSIVPGATHLFEEPGTLDEVARLAADWFTTHLAPAPAGGRTDVQGPSGGGAAARRRPEGTTAP